MVPIDFSEMLDDYDIQRQSCMNLAPWVGVFSDGAEYNVYCHLDQGHLGRHAGNGWTWEDEKEKDSYPLLEQELVDANQM